MQTLQNIEKSNQILKILKNKKNTAKILKSNQLHSDSYNQTKYCQISEIHQNIFFKNNENLVNGQKF